MTKETKADQIIFIKRSSEDYPYLFLAKIVYLLFIAGVFNELVDQSTISSLFTI